MRLNYLFGPTLFLGASACNLISHPTHQRESITAYVVRTIDDPDSYQALWWGPPRIVSKSEKARMDRLATARAYTAANQQAQADALVYQLANSPALATPSLLRATATIEEARRRYLQSARTRDSLRYILRHLPFKKDTARYGYLIAHGYSALDRSGKPFRDSALFLVDVEANVIIWHALGQAGK